MKKPTVTLIIFALACILACAGLFLFAGKYVNRGNGDNGNNRDNGGNGENKIDFENSPASGENVEKQGAGGGGMERMDPVRHTRRIETINGHRQVINILEIDPGAPGVKIMPVLSHDLVYGFEKLSEMAARKKAYAAVNGGFFHEYGLPSGMVVIDGELISASGGKYPVFVVEDGRAELKEIKSSLFLEYFRGNAGTEDNVAISPGNGAGNTGAGGGSAGADTGGGAENGGAQAGGAQAGGISAVIESVAGVEDGAGFSKTGRIHVDNINVPAGRGQVIAYTPAYGNYNRASGKNITITVEDGIVVKIADYAGEVEIPGNGMLVTIFDTGKYAGAELPVKVGDAARLAHYPEIGKDMQAYECGSWLVRDGKPVAGGKDEWVGVLTNRDPRTAIGIKRDNTVVLFTVDGRQPGYSAGFTGQELAEYLAGLGVKDAAMLDGGASTEMLVGGRLVNRPSYMGQERKIGGGVLVLLERQ